MLLLQMVLLGEGLKKNKHHKRQKAAVSVKRILNQRNEIKKIMLILLLIAVTVIVMIAVLATAMIVARTKGVQRRAKNRACLKKTKKE